jgi:asparagine synthase (glutamine-hydrolysing)
LKQPDAARLVSWNRLGDPALPSPRGHRGNVVCLWTAGFLAHRKELRSALGAPTGTPDAELLLRAYERHGLETPAKLAGPFAWALWDSGEKRLVAARDRLGTRALYYTVQGEILHLASGLEALLATLPSPLSPNPLAVHEHLHGLPPRPGETFYQGISILRPGEVLVATRDRLDRRLYWRIEPRPPLRLENEDAYAEAVWTRLLQAVEESAPEGPTGVAMSGGFDSTSVATALRVARPEAEITVFTWTARDLPEADESFKAEATARALGYPVIPIPADRHWPLSREPGIRPAPEGPLYNFYTDVWEVVFEAARERGIPVLLTGYGGDSLFGGNAYSYPDLLLTGRWLRLAGEVRRHLPRSSVGFRGILRRMILSPILHSLLPQRAARGPRPVPWLGPKLAGLREARTAASREWLLPGRLQRLGILRDPFISAVALQSTDHASRHGIDLRHALLDHRLWELAAALPSTQTFAAGNRKIALRNALRRVLPPDVWSSLGKTYPSAIAHHGLRERETGKVWDLLRGMRAADMGFGDEALLHEEYRSYLAGKNQGGLLWQALTLEAWLRQYFP